MLTRTLLHSLILLVAASTAATGLRPAHAEASSKIQVVATTTDLKALTEAVGGDLVDVAALARGNQNPHDLEVRPSLMVKVRRADLLVMNGLELDQWAEVVVQGAGNPRVGPGAPGRIDASAGLLVLEVPQTKVDRSMGDVHPVGNPHYSLDPGMAPGVTANILEGLARIAPQSRPVFERNRQAFLARVDQALAGWNAAMAPFKGAKVVVDHNQWIYFLTRFGLVEAGSVEERPGIPPTPSHLTTLIALMKDQKVRVILSVPWSDQKIAERVAAEAGAKVVPMAPAVGAVKGADGYVETIDYNVRSVAQALK
jgi:zinc/manganese transport system substrate-binding protein